jgi:hypothetical protein
VPRPLSTIIAESIAEAGEMLVCCQEELDGKQEISNLHRNFLFHLVNGAYRDYNYWKDDEHFATLRSKASDLVHARDVLYDQICRKYLDLEDVKIRLLACEDDSYPRIWFGIERGDLIGGADVLNYACVCLKQTGSNKGFDAYKNISEEWHSRPERRTSVLEEIQLYRDYIALCRRDLTTNT